MQRRSILKLMLAAAALTVAAPYSLGAAPQPAAHDTVRVWSVAQGGYIMVDKVRKTAEEWRQQLTPEQYYVTREKGTERAYTGKDWDNHADGIYRCVCCGQDLFDSTAKYDSGTGWPSFTEPVAAENVAAAVDRGLFTVRTEILCSRCDAHLGHVFDDGPAPKGLRYCMNGAALTFVPRNAIGK